VCSTAPALWPLPNGAARAVPLVAKVGLTATQRRAYDEGWSGDDGWGSSDGWGGDGGGGSGGDGWGGGDSGNHGGPKLAANTHGVMAGGASSIGVSVLARASTRIPISDCGWGEGNWRRGGRAVGGVVHVEHAGAAATVVSDSLARWV